MTFIICYTSIEVVNLKRLFSLIIAAAMLACIAFSAAAYDAKDAYNDFKKQYPDFVGSLLNGGIDEQLLIEFLRSVQSYMIELDANEKITESNFENKALSAVNIVSSREKYVVIQDTLIILYPDAVKQVVVNSTVPEEFKPLMNTIKSIFFNHNMLDNGSSSGTDDNSGSDSDGDDTPQTPITPKPVRFTDVPLTHWAYEAIESLSEKFILNGYLDGAFRPDASITRGEFAKIIVTAANVYDYAATSEFSDVPSDAWYYSYVSSAYKAGLITGYPNGSFAPDAPISRADICTIVYRSLKSENKSGGVPFDDDALIPDYARTAVYSLTDAGIISGMGANMFAPLANATRAQTAKIVYKSFK